ncbi:MAG TPA: Trp biosynthesis-associated membrane protein [Nocardioidaceae bacterium]|nr:Trp biosynthesis-associated membrane protein [Nocardioidaceae bacterium]
MADRRSFWPVVVLGAAASALAATAASRPWATATAEVTGAAREVSADGSDVAPLALALSLVALASWGALLVTRTRGRRVAAVVGLVASAGTVAAAATSYNRAVDEAIELGGGAVLADGSHTAWYFVLLVAAAAASALCGVALRSAGSWPEMGARYDAPGGQPPSRTPDQADLWKALDEGHDPTA